MSLRDKLAEVTATATGENLFDQFGVIENPYPASSQTAENPHRRSSTDDEIDERIQSFVRDGASQVMVIVGSQGTGKTNVLNFYEKEIKDALEGGHGYYVVRYLADPEASFDSTLRRLFQELGPDHLQRLAEALAADERAIESARSHEVRVALRALAESGGRDEVVSAMNEWLLGLRLLKAHREALHVNFRLDTVESKTAALRDIVQVSSELGLLKGIFLLLDELEKQDGVLSATAVVRYLSAMRAIIDALPKHLFMMIAVTPDALRRYSNALPAFRSRLENRIELSALESAEEALALAEFYLAEARERASKVKGTATPSGAKAILSQAAIEEIFATLLARAQRRGDEGLRQREFLHALHVAAEEIIQPKAA